MLKNLKNLSKKYANSHLFINSNWNLEMLVFVEGGKPENLEKNPQSKAGTNNKLNPHRSGYPDILCRNGSGKPIEHVISFGSEGKVFRLYFS